MSGWWRWWERQTAPRVPHLRSSEFAARTAESAARAQEADAHLADLRRRLTALELAALSDAHDDDQFPGRARHA